MKKIMFSDNLRSYMIGDDFVERDDFIRAIRNFSQKDLDVIKKEPHMITKDGIDYMVFNWDCI